jgi:hypothetical protein
VRPTAFSSLASRHAGAADLPVDEIIAVADTVVVRPDPEPVG